MRKSFYWAIGMSVLLTISGCSSTPPKVAQNKMYEASGQKLDLGGTYDVKANNLSLTVNGDPIMRGKFPPFTPTINLNSTYKGLAVSASCYFGSVLGSKGGLVGIISGAVQGGVGKGGDKCDITVEGKAADSLYF